MSEITNRIGKVLPEADSTFWHDEYYLNEKIDDSFHARKGFVYLGGEITQLNSLSISVSDIIIQVEGLRQKYEGSLSFDLLPTTDTILNSFNIYWVFIKTDETGLIISTDLYPLKFDVLLGYVAVGTEAIDRVIDLRSFVENSNFSFLAETIDVPVSFIAIFIGSVRNDSDGGRWIKNCHNLSWYNEPLNTDKRGRKREFPIDYIIATTTSSLYIFDATEPDFPMWMIFDVNTTAYSTNATFISTWNPRTIKMLNGVLAVGGDNGLVTINFLTEQQNNKRKTTGSLTAIHKKSGRIIDRNDTSGQNTSSLAPIVNNLCRDISMVIMENANINVRTGLPIPTIAVATDGGVSIIHGPAGEDTVVNITLSDITKTYSYNSDFIDNENLMFSIGIPSTGSYLFETIKIPSVNKDLGAVLSGDPDFASLIFGSLANRDVSFLGMGGDQINGICCKNIAFGTLSGLTLIKENEITPAKSLVNYITKDYQTGWFNGGFIITTLCSSIEEITGPELLSNDSFDSGLTDWEVVGNAAAFAVVAGQLVCIEPVAAEINLLRQTIDATIGEIYNIRIDTASVTALTANDFTCMAEGTTLGSITATGLTEFAFTATTVDPIIQVRFTAAELNDAIIINYISAKRQAPEPDRSPNAYGLTLRGTLSKVPFDEGCNLVAFSGFSTLNYLTATNAAFVDTLFAYGWQKDLTTGWTFKSGTVSAAPIDGLTIAATVLKIAGTLDKALIRLTTASMTSGALAFIEQTERSLFNQGSFGTLYGASNIISGLCYDEMTKVLSVLTSDNIISRFQDCLCIDPDKGYGDMLEPVISLSENSEQITDKIFKLANVSGVQGSVRLTINEHFGKKAIFIMNRSIYSLEYEGFIEDTLAPKSFVQIPFSNIENGYIEILAPITVGAISFVEFFACDSFNFLAGIEKIDSVNGKCLYSTSIEKGFYSPEPHSLSDFNKEVFLKEFAFTAATTNQLPVGYYPVNVFSSTGTYILKSTYTLKRGIGGYLLDFGATSAARTVLAKRIN